MVLHLGGQYHTIIVFCEELKGGKGIKKAVILLMTVVISTGVFSTYQQAKAADANSKAGVVSITSGKLNVRSGKATTAAIVATLNKGSYITLISRSGDWWYVEYGDGMFGYCHKDYISGVAATAKNVNIQWGNLNVRSGAGTSYGIKDKLSKDEGVLVLTSQSGWSRILYNGTETGYVSDSYLSSYTDEQHQASTYSKVSLNVPSYKQTDSRWASIKVGNSGKTIAQIGCTTTAIAMIESYKTATVIYPNAMVKKLSYTSSGDLYWPSNYNVVTNSSGYLSGIYNKLKQGKPVLFGAKNSYGSQHWVVVTGFKGGSLSASNFTINDPGSNTRVTLQQFLNSYSRFYKYFYY